MLSNGYLIQHGSYDNVKVGTTFHLTYPITYLYIPKITLCGNLSNKTYTALNRTTIGCDIEYFAIAGTGASNIQWITFGWA